MSSEPVRFRRSLNLAGKPFRRMRCIDDLIKRPRQLNKPHGLRLAAGSVGIAFKHGDCRINGCVLEEAFAAGFDYRDNAKIGEQELSQASAVRDVEPTACR